MTSCPELSILEQNSNAREDHLSSCTTCRTLFALRDGGDEEFGAECEATETLIAVASDMTLNAIDQRRLTKHLKTCARCSSLACGLLLHGDAEASVATASAEVALQSPVSPLGAGTTPLPQPANDQRKVIFVALGLLTAAAALVLIYKGFGAAEKSKTRDLATRVAPEEPKSESPAAETPTAETPIAKTPTLNTPTVTPTAETPTAETPTPKTPTAETPTPVTPTPPSTIIESESTEEESAVGVSRPALPAKGVPAQPPTQGVNPAQAKLIASQLHQARNFVRAEAYREGFRLAKEILALEPGNQDAIIVAAIATCNLRRTKEATRYVSLIKSRTRRMGLKQICSRLGIRLVVDIEEPEEPEEPEEGAAELTSKQRATVLALVEKGEAAVRNEQYGGAGRNCRKALALDPENQRAAMVCAIAACNLDNGTLAKKYIRRVDSTSRRNGLKQICSRLGVDTE